jgi:acyl carrier protein
VERDEVLAVLIERLGPVTEADAFADKGVDSLATVELVLDLEEAFGVELDEADVQGARTVGDLADLVVSLSGRKTA